MNCRAPLQIVTASDARFYHHLSNLLYSIECQEGCDYRLTIVDVGLLEWQRVELAAHGVGVLSNATGVFGLLKPAVAFLEVRPALPALFPEATRLLWMDADIWIQRLDYLKCLSELMDRHDFLVSPQLHVAYGANSFDAKLHPKRHGLVRPSGFNYDLVQRIFGADYASKLSGRPTLNGGLFGGRRDCSIWQAWERIYRRGESCRGEFGIDQVTLMSAVAASDAKVALLPPKLNWLCHFSPPAYDRERRRFVEPTPMFDELYALHLTSFTKYKPCLVVDQNGGRTPMELFDPEIVHAAITAQPLPLPRSSAHDAELLEAWPKVAFTCPPGDGAFGSTPPAAQSAKHPLKALAKKLRKALRPRLWPS